MLQDNSIIINQHLNGSELVIFDFDGTLVDLEELNYSSLNRIVREYTGQSVDMAMYRNEAAGVPSAKGIERVFRKILGGEVVDQKNYDFKKLSRQFRQYKKDGIEKDPLGNTKLIPSADNLVNRLKDCGKHLAICSSSAPHFVQRLLSMYGIFNKFEFVITADDVKLGKPDPEPYNLVVDHFKVDPRLITVFEDSSFGLRSAKAAGLFTIGILNQGWNDDYVFRLADLVIDDYREVVEGWV